MKLLPFLLLPMTVFAQMDKVQHFAAGQTISAITSLACKEIGLNKRESILIGFTAGCLAGVAKEVYDRKHGTVSYKDAVWTAIGSGAASITLTITLK